MKYLKLNTPSNFWKYILFLPLIIGFSCKEKRLGETDQKIENSVPIEKGFISIFDGKTLKGWDGDNNIWSAEDGILIGELKASTNLKNNTFLIWKGGEPKNFELKLEFRISESGNSGVNYRSDLLDSIPFALRGYQADIDGKNTYTGQNYEERKRSTLAYRGEKATIATQPNPDNSGSLRSNIKQNAWQSREVLKELGNTEVLKSKISKEKWNNIHLIVNGNRLQHYVNGILMSEVIDNDTVNRKSSGNLGLQIHVGPPMKVEYRNIWLKNL